MCIMFIKEPDKDFPSDRVLKRCWQLNPSGAGIAWYQDKLWKVEKGMMSFGAFKEKFDKLNKEYNLKEKIVCVHFRAGNTGPPEGATHPFPFHKGTNKGNIHWLSYSAPSILFHNGTMGRGSKEYSDTAEWCLNFSFLMPYLYNKKTQDLDENFTLAFYHIFDASISRFALCTPDGVIHMLGPWVEDKESGLYYSNKDYIIPDKKIVTSFTHSKVLYLNMVSSNNEYSVKFKENGSWNWERWDNRFNLKDTNKKSNVGKQNNNIITIYNADGHPYVKIDNSSSLSAATQISRYFSNDKEEKKEIDYQCPVCNERDLLIEPDEPSIKQLTKNSSGLDNFVECVKCGTIWGYTTIYVTPWIIGYRQKNKSVIGCGK